MAKLVTYAYENELEKGFKEALETFNVLDTRADVNSFVIGNTGTSDNKTYFKVTNTDLNNVSTVLYNGKKQYYNTSGDIERLIRYNGTNWEIDRFDDDEGEQLSTDDISTDSPDYPWEIQNITTWSSSTTFSNPIGGSFTVASGDNLNVIIPDDTTTETPANYIYIEAEIGEPVSDERTNADGNYDHFEADLSFEIVTNRLDESTPPNDPDESSSTVSNFHDYMVALVRYILDGTASAVTTAFTDEPLAVVKIIPEKSERSKDEDDRTTVLQYKIQFMVKVET